MDPYEHQEKINNINAEIEELRHKAERADDYVRHDYEQTIEHLEQKKDELVLKMTDLRNSGEALWQKGKEGTKNAVDSGKDHFENLRNKM
jgi:hypothetical protein